MNWGPPAPSRGAEGWDQSVPGPHRSPHWSPARTGTTVPMRHARASNWSPKNGDQSRARACRTACNR